MQQIHLDTIQQFNDYNGMETLHPLVSVIHVDNTEHIKECMMHYSFYAIYLKEKFPDNQIDDNSKAVIGRVLTVAGFQ